MEIQSQSWQNCHVDIWFIISRYMQPEDTLKFALICKQTWAVTNSEAFWRSLFTRFIRSKYPWLDVPDRTNIRQETIRELFKTYDLFVKRRVDVDGYDKANNKSCLQINHELNEDLKIRTYKFRLKARTISHGKLAASNKDEGCQLLLISTRHYVDVPFELDNLVIKSITKRLSHGFRSYKITIQFCDLFSNRAGEVLVFDPIVNVKLINWWDPNY